MKAKVEGRKGYSVVARRGRNRKAALIRRVLAQAEEPQDEADDDDQADDIDDGVHGKIFRVD